MNGLVGRKIGMTQIFTEVGMPIPITVIEVNSNYVTQIRSLEKDGYCAVQITTGIKKTHRINKPILGHFKKSNIIPGRGLWEFRLNGTKKKQDIFLGQKIGVDFFSSLNKVDITGFSKGKGFSGTVKRWNFKTQDASHGNSLSHRAPGSIGQNQTPGRVFKGKKMAGRLGNEQVTIQNLKIIRIDVEKNLLMIKGSVPGPIGGTLIVRKSIKSHFKKKEI